MARGHGRILTSIWEDADFLALTEPQQRMYLFLISQPNLNHAGLLPLTLRRWARKAHGLTAAELEKHLLALAEGRFIVLDEDTEELLIRSFVRNDGVWKQPKVMGAMVSGALEISSRLLQSALLSEMDRIPLEELSDEPTKLRTGEGPSIRRQVAEHIATLRKAFGDPNPDPTQGGSVTPSASPSATPSGAPAEGGREGSTRGRAGVQTRASPAPAPAPFPCPVQEGSAEADGQTELVVVTDSDFVGALEEDLDDPEPVTAQTIVGEWIDRCTKRPPGQTIGQTSKQIKNLLDEGIHPDDIRTGLSRWMAKGCSPSAIPSFVNEAMNAQPQQRRLAAAAGAENVLDFSARRPSTADLRAGAAFALAAELAEEDADQ